MLADIVNAVLERAQIPFHWVQMPPARIFYKIKTNEIQVCAPGKYWTAERQQYANYEANYDVIEIVR